MRLAGIDHLVLTVRDIDRTVAFYARLGAAEIVFGDGRRALAVGAQKINLHASGAEIAPHAERPEPGSADLCLLVDGPIGEVAAHLAREGIPVELGPVARTGAGGPITSLYVRDPDGNLVELAQPSG